MLECCQWPKTSPARRLPHRLKPVSTNWKRSSKNSKRGDLSLERSLELFERGMGLSDTCRKQLEEAETRVEMLIRRDGKIVAEPFRPEKS